MDNLIDVKTHGWLSRRMATRLVGWIVGCMDGSMASEKTGWKMADRWTTGCLSG